MPRNHASKFALAHPPPAWTSVHTRRLLLGCAFQEGVAGHMMCDLMWHGTPLDGRLDVEHERLLSSRALVCQQPCVLNEAVCERTVCEQPLQLRWERLLQHLLDARSKAICGRLGLRSRKTLARSPARRAPIVLLTAHSVIAGTANGMGALKRPCHGTLAARTIGFETYRAVVVRPTPFFGSSSITDLPTPPRAFRHHRGASREQARGAGLY
jgi:hypothetical protein